MAKHDDQTASAAADAPTACEPSVRDAATALSGPGVLPLDHGTAVLHDLWGWTWASIAAETGALTAATDPLPGNNEAIARHFAQETLADTGAAREWVRDVAKYSAWLAIDSFRSYLGRVRELQQTIPFSNELVRNADEALREAENFGRLAATWNRVFVLVERELEGQR